MERTRTLVAALMIGLTAWTGTATAAEFEVDPDHTAVVFKIAHLGMSDTYGRFNDVQGQVKHVEGDLAQCSFDLTVRTDSVDTNSKKRDDHLRGPDFFNAAQFPVITFKSTAISRTADGLAVTGDLSLHGVTKSVTVDVVKGGEGPDPWGNHRIGFSTTFQINRRDYGMTNMVGAVGEDVTLMISFEGIRQN